MTLDTLWQKAGLSEHLLSELAALTQARLDDELHWLPIRHHSPSCAYMVQQTILTQQPTQVFIEAPVQYQDLLTSLIDKQTSPPIALYSSFNDINNEFGLAGITTPSVDIMPAMGSWMPLLDYSPEYVAIKAAAQVGAEVIFIDLPAHVSTLMCTSEKLEDEMMSEHQYILSSQFFQLLFKAGNYHHWNECWDSLFEMELMNLNDIKHVEHYRHKMAAFSAAVRLTSNLDEQTLYRETFMWQKIQQHMKPRQKETDKKPVVVCGGLHMFMLKPSVSESSVSEPSEPESVKKDNFAALTFGQEYHTIVPFSYDRISEHSGYKAGNRAPYFYQKIWQALAEKMTVSESVYEHIQYLIHYARKKGQPLSSADAVSSVQHALMLSQLRHRKSPILDDMLDAIMTCCCKGNPEQEGLLLQRILLAALTGHKKGHVSVAVAQLPLVKDFYRALKEHLLEHDHQYEYAQHIQLDTRDVKQKATSIFLHRLHYLNVPFAELIEKKNDHGLVFKARWSYHLRSGTQERLIELSQYGDTLEAVVIHQLQHTLSNSVLMSDISAVLLNALDMALPQTVMHAQTLCQRALVDDHHFVSLTQGFTNLLLCQQRLALVDFQVESLQPLLLQCFRYASHALLAVSNAPADEEKAIVQGLLQLCQAYLSDEQPALGRDNFIDCLNQVANASPVPFLRGCFCGALMELRERSPAALAAEICQYQYAAAEQIIECSLFIEGVIALSHTSILLGAKEIITAIDQLLETAEQPVFEQMMVHLRAAFERLNQVQRLRLADVVAQHYGLTASEQLNLNASVATAKAFARLDNQVADIMHHWLMPFT